MSENKIRKDMTFGEILQEYPKAAEILMGYGLHCIGCHIGVSETLEQGVMAHGMDQATLDRIVDDLNANAV